MKLTTVAANGYGSFGGLGGHAKRSQFPTAPGGTGPQGTGPMMQNEANLLWADRQWTRGGKVAPAGTAGPERAKRTQFGGVKCAKRTQLWPLRRSGRPIIPPFHPSGVPVPRLQGRGQSRETKPIPGRAGWGEAGGTGAWGVVQTKPICPGPTGGGAGPRPRMPPPTGTSVQNEANFRPGPTRWIWNTPPYAGRTGGSGRLEFAGFRH